MRYRELKCNSRSISGERTESNGHWAKFHIAPNLFLVSLAIDLKPETIPEFMAMADGFGERGLFPSGFDWTGVRDSSQAAKVEMGNHARRTLARFTDWTFLDIGLSQELVAMHIRKEETT